MKSPLWYDLFKKMRDPQVFPIMEILKKIPIFEELSSRELKKIIRIIYRRDYQEGELIFKKGQPGAAMFIINEGSAEIFIDGGGKSTVLAELERGDFFGELALLDDDPRSASARALEDSSILAFYRGDLEKLLEKDALIGSRILKKLAFVLGKRLKATNEMLMRDRETGTEDINKL